MTLDITNGKKTTELDALLYASKDDILIIRTGTGVKKITKANLLRECSPDYMNEGRNLTVVFADEISNYSNAWEWIQARLDAHDLDDLRAGDYIQITLTTNEVVEMQIAGINTYVGIFSGAVKPMIDWISRDCLATTHNWNATNVNNGDANEAQPFMASALYAWLESDVYPTLPTEVKNVIKGKRLYMPIRYTSGSSLTDDASWADKTFPHLWVPFEGEIFDHASWSTKGFGTACCVVYELFRNSWKARMKKQGRGGSYCAWWSASAYSGNSTSAVPVHTNGMSNGNFASAVNGVPVCFRTMAAS